MKGELFHTQHPYRTRILWGLFWFLTLFAFAIGLFIAADKIKTHTLPTGKVELKIPYSKYLVGETISFQLKNDFNSPIYVINNCPNEPLAVYRKESNGWMRIHDQASDDDCPDEKRQVSVPANGLVNGTFSAWHNLFNKPGKYRVVAFVEYYNALPYQEFEIIEPPVKQSAAPSSSSTQESESQDDESSTTPVQQSLPTPAPITKKQSKTIPTNRGSISVEYDTTNIYVISIAPASGCSYEGGSSGPQVQVTFKCPSGETQVQLNMVNGQLVPTIESGED